MDIRKRFSPGTRLNFGKNDHVQLLPALGPVETAKSLAAYAQHRICLAAKRRLDQRGSSVTALAEALYQHPTTLQRKFRGEETATLAEMLSWCIALGMLGEWSQLWSAIGDGQLPPLDRSSHGDWDLEPIGTLRLRPLPPLRTKPTKH